MLIWLNKFACQEIPFKKSLVLEKLTQSLGSALRNSQIQVENTESKALNLNNIFSGNEIDYSIQ